MDEYLEIELQPLDEFDSMDIDIGTDECCSDYLDVEIGSLARVGGTTDYNDLENKPQINGVILEGNKTPQDLHITTSPTNWYDCTGRNQLFNVEGTGEYVYLLFVGEEDEKNDLTKYYIVISSINPDDFNDVITEIIKSSILY